MHNNTQENTFERFYLWSTIAKSTMGLFFIFHVFMYLLMGLVSPGPVVELNFFTALQMAFADFFIGIVQQLLLPGGGKLTPARCLLWMLLSALIALVFSLVFGWFAAFPLWCLVVFVALTGIGILALFYSLYLQLQRETRRLNQRLAAYQSQKK